MKPFEVAGSSTFPRVAGALLVMLGASGCHDKAGAGPGNDQAGAAPTLTTENRLAAIPLGDKATGPDKNVLPVKNPYAGSAQAVEAGKRLFVKMNCAGCHAYTGKGWMGPDLSDHYWRYGGSDDEIYKTLYEGRPQGMPAWGKTLPPDQLWQLVTYVQSLSSTPEATKAGGSGTGDVPATRTDVGIDALPPGANASGNNAPNAVEAPK
jgi:cytochrome c oxidase cbb3-type subunit 3